MNIKNKAILKEIQQAFMRSGREYVLSVPSKKAQKNYEIKKHLDNGFSARAVHDMCGVSYSYINFIKKSANRFGKVIEYIRRKLTQKAADMLLDKCAGKRVYFKRVARVRKASIIARLMEDKLSFEQIKRDFKTRGVKVSDSYIRQVMRIVNKAVDPTYVDGRHIRGGKR